jgi:hypothetical protein
MERKEAKELCIRKWEYIVEHDGKMDSAALEEAIPELTNLLCNCAYCELYYNDDCTGCPINLSNANIRECGCRQENHPFLNWCDYHSKENAQKVLFLIKNKPV